MKSPYTALPQQLERSTYALHLHCRGNELSKAWFVRVSVKLTDGRIYRKDYKRDLANYTTIATRTRRGQHWIKELGKLLRSGWRPAPPQGWLPEQITNQPVGLHAALLEALEAKRSLRRATFKSYYMVMTKLEAFCGQRFGGWPLVGDFSTADARAYQQWLHKGGLGNTSVNTYCTCTAGLFAEVVRAGHIEANPFFRLPKLRIDPKLHRPFTPEQMQLIHTHLLERHPVLGFFIELMHYSLLRPAEICKLKFEHLDPKTGRLLVPGEVRKNRKPHMALLPSWTVDKWEALARDYPRHYHVFGFRFSPGERPAVRDSFSTRHRAIMDELGFGAHYTLYSWRHSGAAALVEAGVDIFDLQRQMGHSNPTTTQVYLRALGFVPSKDLRAKFVQLGTGPGP